MNDLYQAIRRNLRMHCEFEIVDIPFKSRLFGLSNYNPGLFVPSISKNFDAQFSHRIHRQWETKEIVLDYPRIPIDKADPQLARSIALGTTPLQIESVGPRMFFELSEAFEGLKRDSYVLVGIHDKNKYLEHKSTDGKLYLKDSMFLCAANIRIK
jgi:hypothetical protein